MHEIKIQKMYADTINILCIVDKKFQLLSQVFLSQ